MSTVADNVKLSPEKNKAFQLSSYQKNKIAPSVDTKPYKAEWQHTE